MIKSQILWYPIKEWTRVWEFFSSRGTIDQHWCVGTPQDSFFECKLPSLLRCWEGCICVVFFVFKLPRHFFFAQGFVLHLALCCARADHILYESLSLHICVRVMISSTLMGTHGSFLRVFLLYLLFAFPLLLCWFFISRFRLVCFVSSSIFFSVFSLPFVDFPLSSVAVELTLGTYVHLVDIDRDDIPWDQ